MREPKETIHYFKLPNFGGAKQDQKYTLNSYFRYVSKVNKEGVPTHTGKLAVLKRYINMINSPEHMEHYKFFIRENMTDQYLSRILHKQYPYAPKGKFQKHYHYTSELPPLRQHADSHEDVIKQGCGIDVHDQDVFTLMNEFISETNPRVVCPYTNGLISSIVFCMITGNADCKTENLAAYKIPGADAFNIAPFDLGFGLNNLGKANYFTKNWELAEFMSVIQGTATKSGQRDTAEALLETVARFGMRATREYNKRPIYPILPPILHKMIANELDRIAKDLPEGQRDHSHALLHMFKQQCEMIEQHKEEAYRKTLANIDKRVLPGLANELGWQEGCKEKNDFRNFILSELNDRQDDLNSKLQTFKGYIETATTTLAAAIPVAQLITAATTYSQQQRNQPRSPISAIEKATIVMAQVRI